MDGSSFLCILNFISHVIVYFWLCTFFFRYDYNCPSTNVEPDIGFCLGNTKEESDHWRPKRKNFLYMTLLVG